MLGKLLRIILIQISLDVQETNQIGLGKPLIIINGRLNFQTLQNMNKRMILRLIFDFLLKIIIFIIIGLKMKTFLVRKMKRKIVWFLSKMIKNLKGFLKRWKVIFLKRIFRIWLRKLKREILRRFKIQFLSEFLRLGKIKIKKSFLWQFESLLRLERNLKSFNLNIWLLVILVLLVG